MSGRSRRGAAVIVVAGAVAAATSACSDGESTALSRTTTSPSATPAETSQVTLARAVADAAHAAITDLGVDGRGDLLVVWRNSWRPKEETAFAIRPPTGRVVLAPGPPHAEIDESRQNGWTIRSTAEPTYRRLLPSGEVTAASMSEPTANPLRFAYPPGRAVVVGRVGGRTVHATVDRGPGVRGSSVTRSEGAFLALTEYHPRPQGDDEENPAHALAVSTDGGRTWRTTRLPADLRVLLGSAHLRSGTTLLAFGTGPCPMVRVPAVGPAGCEPSAPRVDRLVGDGVVAWATSTGRRELWVSRDDGRTWRRTAVPGRSRP